MLPNHIIESKLKNNHFANLDSICKQNSWNIVKNELNWICYTKFGDETSYFDIKILQDKIIVSIPIKTSCYQYVTTFENLEEASNYIKQRLYDYI